MARARVSLGVCLGLGILCAASTAAAFCRTTTCNVTMAQGDCSTDSNGCAVGGKPLFWPESCGWFGVQKDGSPKRHITYDQMHSIVVNAFNKWAKADCGGGRTPSFAMQDTDALYGPIECTSLEFNKNGANASAWMFRDTDWPYVGGSSTIALTTLSVEISTGRILDADVELNSFRTNITTSDVNVVADLDSIVTHESGHFLGLAHSPDAAATMFANYSPSSVSIRTLSPDDEAGICAAYGEATPPTCGPPEPIYGFSKYCGGVNPSTQALTTGSTTTRKSCAVSMGSTSGDDGVAVLTVALAAGAVRLRRRRVTA